MKSNNGNDNKAKNQSQLLNKNNLIDVVNMEPKISNFFLFGINLPEAYFFRLALTGIVIVLGGSFHFGYQISLINPLADVLQEFLEHGLKE